MRYKTQGYQRLARLAYVGGDTENVSLLKHIIIPGLVVSGTGIPAITGSEGPSVILSVSRTDFEIARRELNGELLGYTHQASSTQASSSITFTDTSGSVFTHICSTTNADATVTHQPRYDSIPTQYTKKHFRFFRENSIGARRRTYVGTQNTETTSVDFGLPFETFDVNVNTITVGTTTPASAYTPPGGTTTDERI